MAMSNWRLRGSVLVLLAFALLATVVAGANTAFAHPLGNFTINRYARLELYSDAIHLHYVVDMAEIPTFQALDTIDTDGDGASSDAELAAYGELVAAAYPEQFSLTVDGKAEQVTVLETSVQRLPGQGGLDILRTVVVYSAEAPRDGTLASVTFEDRNYADRVGWKEIVVRPSGGSVAMIDPALLLEQSNALLEYPAETLSSAPDMRSATFTLEGGSGESAPGFASLQQGEAGRASTGFASLISKDQSSAWVLLLSLLAAFGFGMLHALGPGHGKTVVAAYLVGSKGTVRHAVALGATVTATHTSTVYIVGFIALAASSEFATEKVQLYIGVAAGLMIIAMGLSLFVNRAWRYLRPVEDDGYHRHGMFGKAHSHMPDAHEHAPASSTSPASVMQSVVIQSDGSAAMTLGGVGAMAREEAHAHPHDHAHEHEDHHAHPHADGAHADGAEKASSRVTWKSLITLGIAGGMLPCPSAIVVMISAIALGKVLFGMLLIVAFSVGLASVLTAIGVALVLGKRLSGRSRLARVVEKPGFAQVARVLPAMSALAVTFAGIGVTIIALNQANLL